MELDVLPREVANQRAILDRRALDARLAEIADAASPDARRTGALEVLKAALADGRKEIRERFETRQATGGQTMRANAFLIDQIVRLVHDFADRYVYPLANPTMAEHLTVAAVGGYGRAEMSPQSDIDLLFVRPYKSSPRIEQMVEFMLYMLWDMGLKVGHATRSTEECIRLSREDFTIRTALLESRYLWGDDKLFAELKRRFFAEVAKGTAAEFVDAKLEERSQRHQRMGDSRYVLEPNVKDGKGGLRDLHTLFWIGKYLHRVDRVSDLVVKGVFTSEEAAIFDKCQEFLWSVRCHLHYVTGRAEDRLTFDVQAEIGRRMGYTDHRGTSGVERFMKHYFLVAKDVGDLTRIFCSALEIEEGKKTRFGMDKVGRLFGRGGPKLADARFAIESGRLTVARNDAFEKDPVNFLRIFRLAQENELDVHPHALRLIRQSLRLVDGRLRADPEANRLFMEILTDPRAETALRRLNEAGVFGRFVPDFGRVVAQMQHDMYHVYTVDEHTIFAIGILHRIEQGQLEKDHPLASEIIHQIQSRRALYFALLLHDIAKGRGGDHSVLGAEIAMKLGPRMGLSEEETETAAWLVRAHLWMSATAFKRDIHDPQAIRAFLEHVQSPERLRLLLCLTVADIRAVGPGVWNNWKAALLRELYYRAAEALAGDFGETGTLERVAAAQKQLREELKDWSDKDFAWFAGLGYPAYWLSLDPATQARHARFVREAERGKMPLAVDTRIDRARTITEITIYTDDHPGLFARIAGAMAVAGANIVAANVFTMSNGRALDTFSIQTPAGEMDGQPQAYDRPEKLAKLSIHIEHALGGRLRLREQFAKRPAIPSRMRVFTVPPRVLIDNTASKYHTLIEVNGRDRVGFLYDVTAAITALGLSIRTAKITTYGERAVDVFYVVDVFGHKIIDEPKLARIRTRLLAAVADPDAPGEQPKPRKRAGNEAAE
ncbi:MAG: [protein-PII] uridylyltransferase [Rhodospirillales bacterium]|nr:[protein-PII] uridylyltransferase [Rhodospirillales bacterium]